MLFMGVNVGLICSACAMFGLSIYLIAKMEEVNVFNMVFMFVSIILFIISICSAKLKKRPRSLCCYIGIQGILFWVMILMSIFMMFRGELITEIAINTYDMMA
jgi:prepilin signal peptidase PulO-like enzyme (type II secretory pathway)